MTANTGLQRGDLPWGQLYRYIERCGANHDLRTFSVEILNGIREFISFDRGLVYFVDGNQHIYNQYLLNMKDAWSNLYLDYYAKESFNNYSISERYIREKPDQQPYVHTINWNKEPMSPFIKDYIQAQGLQNTLAFVLFDLNGVPRTSFALDRMSDREFEERDLQIVKTVLPMLNNLHKNFYAKPIGESDFKDSIWESSGLTSREIDVVNLLCQGVSPNNISAALHIAPSTTYKHIAHVYDKMGVSTLQEFLVKVLNSVERKPDINE